MASGMGGVIRRLRERARRNADLWESFFDANQPWREHGPLRWREARGTWVLDGETPPEPPGAAPGRGTVPGPDARSANTAETATGTHRAR